MSSYAAREGFDNSITEGVIWKQLLQFFFPILFGTFFQQLYNTADAIIVGRFVGKEALAAVGGSTGTLINLLVNLFVGISAGATVTISQYYGARQFDQMRKAIHTSIALAVVAGLAITAVGIPLSPVALRLMGTPEDVMDHAFTYMWIYFAGIICSFLYNMGSGILRAIGDTKRPLYFLIIACFTNISLDLLLVVVLKMGVAGVALATVLAQAVSAVLVMLCLMRADPLYAVSLKEIRISPALAKSIVFIGLPAGFQSDMYTISNMIIQSSVNSFGTNTVAAWTAFGKIDSLYWMVLGALGVSVTTFVGQNFGARKYDRIRKCVGTCLKIALLCSVVISLMVCGLGRYMLPLFTTDADVLELGVQMLFWTVPFYFTYIGVEIYSGAIRGSGEALWTMVLSGCGICLLRTLWVFFVLPFRNQMSTVAASYPISWAITSTLFAIYYYKGGWLQRQIAKKGFDTEDA